MAKALPPLTWFRAFEAAARNLSFTAAAIEIGMTQSGVSQHVKSLESRLGVALFEDHRTALKAVYGLPSKHTASIHKHNLARRISRNAC